jgi:hypothetical protein
VLRSGIDLDWTEYFKIRVSLAIIWMKISLKFYREPRAKCALSL